MSEKKFIELVNKNWEEIFNLIEKDIFEITEELYNDAVKKNKNIFPINKNLFSFTNYCVPSEIKVCIIGQDPYHSVYTDKNGISHPQAHGLAFSVSKDSPIPPSLANIYKNLKKFNHVVNIPPHGCLDFWASQGVLMLNTSLSVEQSKPNSHQNIWFEFTDQLITILSEKYPGIVFVLWGSNAFDKMKLIKNKDTHRFVISSHPSPLSANNKFKQYNSFVDTDHFGLINKYIKEINPDNKEILWEFFV